MTQKIKSAITKLSLLIVLATPAIMPGVASAVIPDSGGSAGGSSGTSGTSTSDTSTVSGKVCSGASNLQIGSGTDAAPTAGDCAGTAPTKKVNDLITLVLNVFSVVVGIMAVIMIIYAGFKYITSGGKDDSVKTAKSTILYAVIGLIIVALAQIIVKFVLNKVGP